jgi:Ca-activated chloride channel homolog
MPYTGSYLRKPLITMITILMLLISNVPLFSTHASTIPANHARLAQDAAETCPRFNATLTPVGEPVTGGVPKPEGATEIVLYYAPESDLYLPAIIAEFNKSVGSQYYVTGYQVSSGTAHTRIAEVVTEKRQDFTFGAAMLPPPTIFQPSVRHWLDLINLQAKQGGKPNVVEPAQARETAIAWVVIAIWESRLNAIQAKEGAGKPIGWEELLRVFKTGWQDYGITERKQAFYGHTDPTVSSTALSTLISEFYASAIAAGKLAQGERISSEIINDAAVIDGVGAIENGIVHYFDRTTEFIQYIARGPSYIDFVALEENDVLRINAGKARDDAGKFVQVPEGDRLVALYPKEGAFRHAHPMAILQNVPWVSNEQATGASLFIDFVLNPQNQALITNCGFRPANREVPLSYLFETQYGLQKAVPVDAIEPPNAELIAEIKSKWEGVKKPSDIVLLIDISGSMAQDVTFPNGTVKNKIDLAKEGAYKLIDGLKDPAYANTRLGLGTFSGEVNPQLVPLDSLNPSHEARLRNAIKNLQTDNQTNLFDAVYETVEYLGQNGRDNAILGVILLSDGRQDTDRGVNKHSLEKVTETLRQIQSTGFGGKGSIVKVFPILYDINVGDGATSIEKETLEQLQAIASASSTVVIAKKDNELADFLPNLRKNF